MISTPYNLYVASNSASRKNLLEAACIPFQVIKQDADESLISTDQKLFDIVMQIAELKMKHAQVPDGQEEGQICFVLTADTLGLTKSGRVLTKPSDRDDAIAMLKDSRSGTITATGFCLRKLEWKNGQWFVLQEVVDYDQASSVFDVPDDFLNFYLQAVPFLTVSGAISIEGIGGQFVQFVNGSYETIIGLPTFKIRKSLWDFGFYIHGTTRIIL